MTWTIEYYEQADGAQPAETFEDALKRDHPKLAGKLRRVLVAVREHGRRLGGGYIEPLHDYPDLWEARTVAASWLAREFFAWDGDTAILLHGYIKRSGQKASTSDIVIAQSYWQDYQTTHHISPECSGASATGMPDTFVSAQIAVQSDADQKRQKGRGHTR